MNRKIIDPNSGITFNMFDPDAKKSIWDPKSEFMKELELYKLRSEIKPRKVNMMQSQVGMIQDLCAEPVKPQIYIPGKGGTY